jgi:hypothetical protein
MPQKRVLKVIYTINWSISRLTGTKRRDEFTVFFSYFSDYFLILFLYIGDESLHYVSFYFHSSYLDFMI